MKFRKVIQTAIIFLLSAACVFAQRPPRPQGPPQQPGPPRQQGPPPGERPPRGGDENKPQHQDLIKLIDGNTDGKIEIREFQSAADEFFTKKDENGNGILEEIELWPGPKVRRQPPGELPIFIFLERGTANIAAAEFTENVGKRFAIIDANGDGLIDRRELDQLRPPLPERGAPPPPTAEFLGAQMRFGDKLVKDSPFSAEIIVENTRRLFDGSTVTKQMTGAFYRDTAGRTRREQILGEIGGFSIGEPQKLVFIQDFAANQGFFVNVTRMTVRQNAAGGRPPLLKFEENDGKTDSLGTKTLEGVNVEGTRTTFEIPIGQIGNDKPIQVVSEKWFSPELQVVVMSKHTDPLAGEQIFRLVNIRLGEPAADLFVVPKNYKVEKP